MGKQLGGYWSDFCYSLALDASGNIYTTGEFSGTADFDPGPEEFNLTPTDAVGGVFISKLNPDGNFVWAKQLGSTNWSGFHHSIALNTSGNVYIMGGFGGTADFDPGTDTFTLTAAGDFDIFIVELSQITTGITAPQFLEAFDIYPNPAGDLFTLQLKGEPQKDILIELFSSTGQTVFSEALDFQSGSAFKDFSCRDLPTDMYLLRVWAGEKVAMMKVSVLR